MRVPGLARLLGELRAQLAGAVRRRRTQSIPTSLTAERAEPTPPTSDDVADDLGPDPWTG